MSRRTTGIVVLVVACLLQFLFLWYLNSRFWYPTDDGLYAHIADRLMAGEVLNRDVQDIHPLYLHAVHVASFHLFGRDLVVLRYPLIGIAVVMTAVAFLLLSRRSLVTAGAAAAVTIGLGMGQYLMSNGNWYALSLFTVLIWWMVARPRDARDRLFVAGVLLGLITCLRHLSGAWAAMAVLSVVLLESAPGTDEYDRKLGRRLAMVMLAGLMGYLVLTRAFRPGGLLLIALWPGWILLWLSRHGRASNATVRTAMVHVGGGGLLVASPLLAYHVVTGSLVAMLADTILSAGGETHMQFFGAVGWYTLLPIGGFALAASAASAADLANGLYWLALPLAWALCGGAAVHAVVTRRPPADMTPPVMAAFFAMISVYLEGPLFLYYSISVTLIALLWTVSDHSSLRRRLAAGAVTMLSAVGVWFHAGQPATRTAVEVLRGTRYHARATGTMPDLGASVELTRADADLYRRTVERIREHVPPNGTLLVLPNDAQLYFLAQRSNVSRFYNSALGLRTAADVQALLRILTERPPEMVIYRSGDKYETDKLRQVMAVVRQRYDLRDVIGGREMWVRRPEVGEGVR